MHNDLTVAVLAGLGGMIGWGAADFFAKVAVDRIGPIKSLVWAHACGAVAFIVVALGQALVIGRTVHQPSSAGSWLGLAGFGILQMVVYWLVYEAFEKGQLAVLNPIFASFTGLVALASVVFFGETLHSGLAIALVVTFIGIILLNLDVQGLKNRQLNVVPGLKEILAATLLAAIWTLGWDKFVGGHDSLAYAMWMYIFMSLAALALARFMKVKLGNVPQSLRKYLLLMGLGETLAYLTISWGYEATSLTSIVALVSGAFSLPTIVLAYAFLKERVTRLQVIAITAILVGVVMVSLS